jgi:tRNA dimethylallyltransferase
VVLAGGSGLYIKAICEGFDDLPTADPAIREKLNLELEQKGLNYLQEKLKLADPIYYSQVDLGNPQRIIRALEVFESSGKPISSYRQSTVNKRPFHIIKLALNMPREVLYRRINDRVDIMLQQGLLAEVASLLPYRHLNALNTVGYTEIFDYMDGITPLDKAVEMIKQNTRRFAKRQLTWFRKDHQFIWFDAEMPDLTEKLIATTES